MEVPRPNKSKGKAKEDDSKRNPNWTAEETGCLLNAVSHIQTTRDRMGFGFNKQERNEIYRLFKVSLPRSTRERGKLINRLKVITKMFKVCHELANRSGGGWDDVMHRPIAPSEAEYEEMIRAKGEGAKFLLRGNFPWYRQMVPMVGGQSAKVGVRMKTYNAEDPIHCLLDTHMTIQCSEQGSSDSPDDGNLNEMDSDFVRSKGKGPASSRAGDGQSSDASFRNSGYFSSKRKSTDESSEPSSKGKRYKERVKKKKDEQDRLALAGLEIARVLSKETKLKLIKTAEEDECMALFDAYGIKGRYHDFCCNHMGNDYRRRWFLKNDKHAIIEWIERNIGLAMPDPIPTPMHPPNATSMPPPNPTFFQPNPAAFNYPPFNMHP